MFIKIPYIGGWYVFGEIVDFNYFFQDATKKGDESIPADEHFQSLAGIGEPIIDRPRLYLLAKRKNGRSLAIKCDFAVYVCNDEGKTIERL